MASQTVHFRQMVVGAETDDVKLQHALRSSKHKYDNKRGVGFVMAKQQALKGCSTRLVFPKTIKAKKVDPKDITSFDFLTEEWAVNFATDIEFDFKRSLAMVTGSRSGFKVIEDRLANIDEVSVHFADLDVDVVKLLRELQKQYPKTAVQSLAVKNYVDPAAYRTNANFKADAKLAQTDEFINKYADQIHTAQIQIMQPDEVYSIKYTKKGSVTFSAKGKDGVWPDFLYGYMADLLKYFNSVSASESPAPEEPSVEGEKSSHLKLVTGAA